MCSFLLGRMKSIYVQFISVHRLILAFDRLYSFWMSNKYIFAIDCKQTQKGIPQYIGYSTFLMCS